MAPRPRSVRLQPLSVEPLSDWTVAQVRGALLEHEGGKFRTSSRLADAMGRDADVAGALATRTRALASRSALPFRVEASDQGDGRKREAARRRMEELWWYSVPEDVTAALMRDAILMGVAVGYLQWEAIGSEWVPRVRWLPTHGLSWERYALDGGGEGWVYTTGDGKRERVTPGDGRWLLHLPGGERSWMTGAVRTCGLPWLMRSLTYRDWVRYCEKHGLPILAIDEPHWAADDVEGTDGSTSTLADTFYSQFATLPSESVLRQPQGQTKDEGGWASRWLEPVSDTWETFKALIERCKGDIHQGLLGRDAASGPRGGDGELATERVRVEYLASDAEGLTTTLRDQVWRPWALYAYDDADVAGWGRWNTRPPPDLKMRAETLDKLGDAAGKLAKLGVDLRPVFEEFGVSATEIPSGEELREAEAAPAAPAAPAEPETQPDDDGEEAAAA